MNKFLMQALALLFLMLPAQAAPLSGTKSVGPTGDYASLTAAIADIQTQTLGGPLVLELQAAYVSTVETFPLVFTNLTTTAANTLTLRPQAGATGLSLSSANTTKATLDLDGAKFVTIDGRPGGVGTAKQLTIANTSTSGVALRFINEASSNIVRYLTIRGVNTSAFSGTVVFSNTTGPSGNDNNTITFCDIGDGASTPANGIYAEGTGTTTAQNNSGNAITNCNVFNFHRSATVDAAGVKLTSGNTDWTLSGNSFYQTVSRAGVAATVRAIYLSNTSNNSHTITGNFIGGTAPNAGGTPWTTTGTEQPYVFVGIWLRVGNNTATSVQGNIIRNFAWRTSSNATTQPGAWSGIHVETGTANIGTVAGNTIGSDSGTGSISVVTSGSGGMAFGIGSNSSQLVTISNNSIGSITANGTTTGIAASITGIQALRGTRTVSGNIVGSTTTANSLYASTTVSTGARQLVTGIECTVVAGLIHTTITGNTVANLQNRSTQTNAMIQGIVTLAGVNNISGNTVRNLTGPSRSTTPSVVGILQGSSAAGQNVTQNVVHSLSNTSNTAIYPPQNVAVAVAGIYYSGGSSGPNVIERNFVHSLTLDSENPSAVVSGLRFGFGCTFTAQNNMVRLGLDASGASTAGGASVRGLHDDDNGASLPRNFIHNSVYVGGTATTGSASSYAYSSTSQNNYRDIRNNIFFNARSNGGGTGRHYAMTYGSVTSPPPGLTSDHNIVYVTGNGGVLARINGTNYTTLGAWQAVTGLDTSSAAVDPRFVNATGNSTTMDLHLQAINPAEGRGVPVATVTNDFDGQTRSSLSPVDIGADAGNFTYDPSPSISYPLLSSGTTANRTLTGWATIVDDGSSPVAGGASAPRLYYKKATDADAFVGNTAADNGWKYVTATNGSSPYSFTVDYSLIQGGLVTIGETIQYFVVAQDTANNLSSIPAAASASANPPVQNINAKPRTGINSYNIAATINGTVTVGSGGNYSSLSGAGGLFAALNAGALTSDLTVNLTNDTTETGSVQLNAMGSNTYPPFTVTIRPNSATMRTISGSAANGLIRLNGAQGVTFDGSFGGSGRYLTFRNTSSNSSASTLIFINDASNNTVRNCVLEGMSSSFGVVSFRTGVITGNDNNTVTENQIRDRSDAAGVPGSLVLSNGSSDGIANSNNLISNNELFNFSSTGVVVATGSNSWTITGNTIYQTTARTSALTGIFLDCLGTNAILGNTIRDLTTSGQTVGIKLSSYTGSTTVAGNRLWNLGNSPGTTNYVRGIYCEHVTDQSVTVLNNMIALGSSGTTSQNLSGIYDDGTPDSTTNILFNTVLLTGSGGTGRDTWAYVYGGKSTATVKNNVFMNLRTGGGNHFAANYPTTSTGTLAMDYNVYSGTGRTTAANFFGSSDISGYITGTPISYAQWKTNVPSDTHSSASTPGGNYSSAMFVDPATGDLHLVPGGNVLVNNKGTPVAGVTHDFDGDLRNTVAPMIGADEYLVPDIIVTETGALTDGASTVNFGTVETGSSSAIKTFTITNPGNAALTNLAIAKDGTNASAFSVSALSSTEIPPGGGNATFTVTFNPSLVGAHTAALHLASNLSGSINPFDIALTGTGTSTNANLSALTLSSGTLDPSFSSATMTYIASVANATTSITVTPTREQSNATIEARVNGGGYSPVASGSTSGSLALNVGSNTINLRITSYAGNMKIYTVTVTRRAVPTVSSPMSTSITATGATLRGNLTANGAAAITERGVVYAAIANNIDPFLEGSGVTKVTGSGTTGFFNVPVTGLEEGTTYSFRAYASNGDGTFYSDVAFFVTDTDVVFNSGSANFAREILPGGRQVFNFTLTDPRIVSLATLGGTALRAELYDSEGNFITSFTGAANSDPEDSLLAGNANFDFEGPLLAGDYELHVFHEEAGGPAQTFELTIDASVIAASRPDVAVGPSPGTLTGRSVYSPARQLVNLTSKRLRAVTGHASVSNSGKLPDVLAVSGGRGTVFFKVVWSGPTGNITAALNTGTYRTPEMKDGTAEVLLRAKITPNKGKLTRTNKKTKRKTIVKKTFRLSLQASSTFDPAISDAATIQVKTK